MPPNNLLILLLTLLLAVSCWWSQVGASGLQEEFVHLLHRASQSKRVHLVSEVEKDGLFLQVEEYVDLDTWSQWLRIKWHQEDAETKLLSTRSVNVLLLNGADQRVILKYSPYTCQRFTYNASENQSPDSVWHSLLQPRLGDNKDPRETGDEHLRTVSSLLSTAPDSPYLAQIPVHFVHSKRSVAWLLGVSGLWAKAAFPQMRDASNAGDVHLTYTQDSGAWNLDLHKYSVDYYFESQLVGSLEESRLDYDKLHMVEVKANYFQSDAELINVVEVDFNPSPQDELKLQGHLQFPVGYNCITDGLLPAPKRAPQPLSDITSSGLIELELVGITYPNSLNPTWNYSVQVKTISMAFSEHPSNPLEHLTMVRQVEDQLKIVHDYDSLLAYTILADEISSTCKVSKISEPLSLKSLAWADEIHFSNGLQIRLSHSSLTHLESTSARANLMVNTGQELVYELNLDINLQLSLLGARSNTSAVWYYEKEREELRLSRIDLIMYNPERSEKLAEFRINFLEERQQLTLVERAKLFDVSACFKRETHTMELAVTYPSSADLLDSITLSVESVKEQFYQLANLENQVKSIATSFNFFRVPKIQVHRVASELLELDMLVLDSPSPLHLFSMLSDTDFSESPQDEVMLAQGVEHCASLCGILGCRMLSFDQQGSSCKLSKLSMELGAGNHSRLHHRAHTNLYYKPSRHLNKTDPSLAELFSYLKHYTFGGPSIEGQLTRVRRDVSEDQSLFSLHLPDGIGHTLTPTNVRSLHVPMMLDVSGRKQTLKVESSFRAVHLNKSYHLDSDIGSSDEKTFDCSRDNATYSLKQFPAVDLYTCSSLCYNIEDWDDRGKSEQTCISLSYCSSEQLCILLIKTDYLFPGKLEHYTGSREQPPATIGSYTELMREQPGCFVSLRSYMDNFEGPIRLNPGAFGYMTTDGANLSNVRHDWLTSFRMLQSDYDEDFQSECADRCHQINKDPRLHKSCVALDFCTRFTYAPHQQTKTYEITCNLFRVDTSQGDVAWVTKDEMDQVRSVLKSPWAYTTASDQLLKTKPEDAHQCNRFLLSHLHDFNHLNHQSLTEKFAASLDSSLPELSNVNLDTCASECALQPRKCSLFQYCNRLDEQTRTPQKSCTLYGRPTGVRVTSTNDNQTLLSSFHQDCHIYIRKNVAADLEALNSLPGGELGWGYKLQDFYTTMFILVLVFFPLVVSVVLVAFDKSIVN